ncbi:MAG: M13 family metallopeptidase [Oligoflexia bacterium]|nr:M13 family metallopeptidase [Oligoflexia bacterium]
MILKNTRLIVSSAILLAFQISPQGWASDGKFDIDLSILDKKVNPCDDFYQYACGAWLKKTEIPADRPMWNRSFSTIDENNRQTIRKLLEGYAAGKNSPSNPYSKLMGDYYGACMDETSIEKNGLPEFKKRLESIEAIKDLKTLAPELAMLHREGTNALFDFSQDQDAKDSTQVIGVVDQGGLGLPDRDYYLKDDAKTVRIRELYREYVTRMFILLGEPDAKAKAKADTILKIETVLAKAAMSRVDRRDPNKVYHRLERKGLLERTPIFDWNAYFDKMDPETTPKLQAINVAVPDYFVALNKTLKGTPLDDLKTYLKWHRLTSATEALPKRFQEERFHFTSTALSGQKKIEARWKRCVRLADSQLGFAVSRAFVDVAYGHEGKVKSEQMIREIEDQMRGEIENLPWMDSKTKEQALAKLKKIGNKVGYPAVWRSYDGLKADRSSFLRSLEAAATFNTEYQLNKIGKPVDRNEWDMTPAIVNAYYNPQLNEMVFPAGILQYPFFNRESPDYLNYGAIGVVMGHELTHGFDDEGRRFDGDGNLRDWWEPSVLAEFDKKTACVEKEYGTFEALPGVHVNGKLTLGENIADQGGMRVSYLAFTSKHNPDKAQPAATPGSPTPEQSLFIAFAQSWCQKEQEPYTRMRVTVDPHSPSRYRVNGVVSQFEPFSRAFGCAKGAPMAPADRCGVW